MVVLIRNSFFVQGRQEDISGKGEAAQQNKPVRANVKDLRMVGRTKVPAVSYRSTPWRSPVSRKEVVLLLRLVHSIACTITVRAFGEEYRLFPGCIGSARGFRFQSILVVLYQD